VLEWKSVVALDHRRDRMIDPQQPDLTRPRGVRGMTTQTYVRDVQERADLGADVQTAGGRDVAGRGAEPRGVRALLQRLWPFGRRG
jgi:hypothetical protein